MFVPPHRTQHIVDRTERRTPQGARFTERGYSAASRNIGLGLRLSHDASYNSSTPSSAPPHSLENVCVLSPHSIFKTCLGTRKVYMYMSFQCTPTPCLKGKIHTVVTKFSTLSTSWPQLKHLQSDVKKMVTLASIASVPTASL